MASNEITRGGGLVVVSQPSPLILLWFTKKNNYEQQKTKRIKHKQKQRGQLVLKVQESHIRQIDPMDTSMKRARKKRQKEQPRGDKTEVPPWTDQR